MDIIEIVALSRFLLRRHIGGADGSRMFARQTVADVIATASVPWNRTTVTLLSPDEFLHVAAPIYHSHEVDASRQVSRFEPVKLDSIQQGISSQGLSEMPHLTVESDDGGNLRVAGHEGRHRALTARRMGISSLPVQLRFAGSPGRPDDGYWPLMTALPTRLLGEGHAANSVRLRALPVSARALDMDGDWAEAVGAGLDAISAAMFFRARASSHTAGDIVAAWADHRSFEDLAEMDGAACLARATAAAQRWMSAEADAPDPAAAMRL